MKGITKDAEKCRVRKGFLGTSSMHSKNGAFVIGDLHIIISDGKGWDHISVSCQDRCPTWDEMCKVKDIFFDVDECIMQLHPPKKDYINYHPFCLHLWRPHFTEIPMPPKDMI